MDLTRRSLMQGSLASAVMATSASSPASAASPALVRLRGALGAAARKAISAQAAPGIAIAIGDRHGLLLQQAYGLANLETGTAVNPRAIFRIGSLTKQFTAAATVRLADMGKLSLDDKVSKHLAAFAGRGDMTIAELIHHTAGLHDDEAAISVPAGPEGPRSQVALAEAIANQTPLFDFPPGTAWLYSNANYIVLGAIVEKASGKPFANALKALVLDPMVPTTLAVDQTSEVVPHRVSGYSLGTPGGRFTNAPFIEISDAGGAGAMRGNPADLVRWHQALLAGRIVSSAGLDFLLSPGRLRDGRLSGANRFSAADLVYGDVQYGGGLLLSPAGAAPRTISHNGFINGFAAMLETNLDSSVSFAVLANADVGPNLPFHDIRAAVRQYERAKTGSGRRL